MRKKPNSRHTGFRRVSRLLVCFLVAGALLAVLASASFGAAPAKPTLTIGGANDCRLVNVDQLAYLPGYAPLIRATPDGDYLPALATSWKLKRNNKSLTLFLRHDARFSDGTPVDSNAIAGWWSYLNTKVYAKGNSAIGPVRSITRSGKWAVTITIQTPDPILVKEFSSAEVGSYWGWPASPAAVRATLAGGSPLTKGTYGAGPYVLDPNQSVIGDHCVYVPNKYYWNKSHLKWGKVVEKYVPDPNAALAALKTGQIQIETTAASTTAAAAAAAGFKLITSPGALWQLFFLDHGGALSKPLSDVRVRQAINYAIDRKTIVRGLVGPGGQATDVPNSGALPGYVPAKDQTYYSYNPTKAKQLLAEAGYGDGFSFKMTCPGDPSVAAADATAFCGAVAKDLAAVGIKVDLKLNPTLGGWYSDDFLSKTFPVLGWVASGPLPILTWYHYFVIPDGAFFHDQHGWRDREIDRLYLKALRATPKKALELFSQMEIRALTQAEYCPVASTSNFTFASKVGASDYDKVALDSVSQWYPAIANS